MTCAASRRPFTPPTAKCLVTSRATATRVSDDVCGQPSAVYPVSRLHSTYIGRRDNLFVFSCARLMFFARCTIEIIRAHDYNDFIITLMAKK